MSKTIYSGPQSVGSDHFDGPVGIKAIGCLVLLVGFFICLLGQPMLIDTAIDMSGGDVSNSLEIWLGWMIGAIILAVVGGFIAKIVFTILSPGKKTWL